MADNKVVERTTMQQLRLALIDPLQDMGPSRRGLIDGLLSDLERELAHARVARPGKHDGEYCATDEGAASVCDGTYGERTDEVLGLVEALDAISALAGGHSEQSKAITKIVDDAIEEHAAWTR